MGQTATARARRGARQRVSVHDASAMPWRDAGKAGIALKTVREDQKQGRFLGLVGFEPMTRSGLHQHQGVATSFFVDGGLTDHQGSVGLHEAGINLRGATHDAIAYQRSILVSRMEAPVVYPAADGPVHRLHAGARARAEFSNPAPAVPPDLNVRVDDVAPVAGPAVGVMRRTIFDYARTGDERRMVQLSLQPGTRVPAWIATEPVEFWVRGGAIEIDGQVAHGNCFVIVEPGAEVVLGSPFGAVVLAWAEGAPHWADGRGGDDLFGFQAP